MRENIFPPGRLINYLFTVFKQLNSIYLLLPFIYSLTVNGNEMVGALISCDAESLSWRSSIMYPSHNDSIARTPLLATTEQHPLFQTHPFYYSSAPSLLPAISDSLLTIIAPILAYWLTAAFFQILDLSNAPWLLRHRIHDSAEVASRNRASRLQVFQAVIVQQVIQTALALLWVSEPLEHVDHAAAMRDIARVLVAFSPLGAFDGTAVMVASLSYLLYWWVIPAMRMLLAMYVTFLSSPPAFSNSMTNFTFPNPLGWCLTRGNTFSTV